RRAPVATATPGRVSPLAAPPPTVVIFHDSPLPALCTPLLPHGPGKGRKVSTCLLPVAVPLVALRSSPPSPPVPSSYRARSLTPIRPPTRCARRSKPSKRSTWSSTR